ncbi:hypothetical protein AB1Y20_013816 [Prymnesium parvum]|uniref:Uncharacterized protein n=1 Tax=Prymnesium parvum TaxID=97485 RepID=A0AB34IHX8_PRYPA
MTLPRLPSVRRGSDGSDPKMIARLEHIRATRSERLRELSWQGLASNSRSSRFQVARSSLLRSVENRPAGVSGLDALVDDFNSSIRNWEHEGKHVRCPSRSEPRGTARRASTSCLPSSSALLSMH